MAATRNQPLELETGDRNELPLASGMDLFEGSMAFADASGNATSVLGAVFLGHVADEANNITGIDTKVSLHGVRYRARVPLSGVALTSIGAQVFASDNNTLTLTPGGNTLVGKVIRYDATGSAIVEFYPTNFKLSTVIQQAKIAAIKANYAITDLQTAGVDDMAKGAVIINLLAAAINGILASLTAAGEMSAT